MQPVTVSPENPCFNSLAEIMQHFEKVPFEQFKADLDRWFKIQCREKANNDAAFRELGGANFPEQLQQLVAMLYSQAEQVSKG